MDNLVVADKEFAEIIKQYERIGAVFEDRINAYLKIMNSIIRGRLMEGATALAVSAYIYKVTALRGQFRDIMKELRKLLEELGREIDNIDRET